LKDAEGPRSNFIDESSGGTTFSEAQTRPKVTGLAGESSKVVAFETFEIFQVREESETKAQEE
jgi:hypothetical protein